MRIAAIIFSVLALTAAGATAVTPPEEIVGPWEGSTTIIVDWCEQPELDIAVVIRLDGTVTGTIGDAELRDGKLVRTGWLGRALGNRNEWIIRSALEGPIVAEEGVVRESVSIPFRLQNGELHGGVHTSGWKFGGRERGILSAANMVLR